MLPDGEHQGDAEPKSVPAQPMRRGGTREHASIRSVVSMQLRALMPPISGKWQG